MQKVFKCVLWEQKEKTDICCPAVWLGLAWFVLVWLGLSWFGLIWLGLALFVLVWLGVAWFVLVWLGVAWFALVWLGLAWFVLVWHGSASFYLHGKICLISSGTVATAWKGGEHREITLIELQSLVVFGCTALLTMVWATDSTQY